MWFFLQAMCRGVKPFCNNKQLLVIIGQQLCSCRDRNLWTLYSKNSSSSARGMPVNISLKFVDLFLEREWSILANENYLCRSPNQRSTSLLFFLQLPYAYLQQSSWTTLVKFPVRIEEQHHHSIMLPPLFVTIEIETHNCSYTLSHLSVESPQLLPSYHTVFWLLF